MHLQAWISTPLFAGFFLAVIADSGIITRSNALATNTLLRHGVRGYIYPDMSHLKAAVYDGWACLGSANLDRLSLRTITK